MPYEQDVKLERISECGYFCTWQRQQDFKEQLADTCFEYMRKNNPEWASKISQLQMQTFQLNKQVLFVLLQFFKKSHGKLSHHETDSAVTISAKVSLYVYTALQLFHKVK